jgi:hypothetical protein
MTRPSISWAARPASSNADGSCAERGVLARERPAGIVDRSTSSSDPMAAITDAVVFSDRRRSRARAGPVAGTTDALKASQQSLLLYRCVSFGHRLTNIRAPSGLHPMLTGIVGATPATRWSFVWRT